MDIKLNQIIGTITNFNIILGVYTTISKTFLYMFDTPVV